MRSGISTFILVLAGPFSWLVPVLVTAAEAEGNGTIESGKNIGSIDCEMSRSALDAINSATAEFIKQGRKDPEVGGLIEDAKNAAWFPECDSVRAKILADKARGLLGISGENLPASRASLDDKPLFAKFDGAWDFGLNAEFIEQQSIGSTSVFDSLIDDKYGLYAGKEFYRTEQWFLGGQLHLVTTNDADLDDADEIAFDSTSLFATARHQALPALQFKLGLSRASYENFFDSGSGSGLAYGIGLTTGIGDFRLHWLDYEVHRIDGEKFETISVNLLVVFCIVGVFFGGNCF